MSAFTHFATAFPLPFRRTLVPLICLSVGIGLSSCTKSSGGQNSAAPSAQIIRGSAADTEARDAYPVTDSDVTPASTNPTVPAPGNLTEDTAGATLPPDRAKPNIYVCTQYIVNAQAKNDKNAMAFAVLNESAEYFRYSLAGKSVHKGLVTEVDYTSVTEDITDQNHGIHGSPGQWLQGGTAGGFAELNGFITFTDNTRIGFTAQEYYYDGYWILGRLDFLDFIPSY